MRRVRPSVDPGLGLSGLLPQLWLRTVVLLAGLAAAVWANVSAPHAAGTGTAGLAAVAVAAVAWLGWAAAGRAGVLLPTSLAVMAAGGGVATVSGNSGLIFVGVAAAGAAVAFDLPCAIGLAAIGPAAYVVTDGVRGSLPGNVLGVVAVCLLGLVSAAGRRQMVERARQAAMIATVEERADVARRQAELVAERNRLGRELHDVLAHTLGALSIQLTALDTLAASGADRQSLRQQIGAGHRLVVEGLDEARQAVRALRGDTTPLVDQLARLSEQHGACLEVSGSPRPMRAESSLALYRVVQEAFTNAAKHAPGAPVELRIGFSAKQVDVTVRNDAPRASAPTALADTGGGYGLQGMAERMRMAGGRCEAGPVDGRWQVSASVPDTTSTRGDVSADDPGLHDGR